MISLKYCCENLEEAKNSHVDFMVDRVGGRIEFYCKLILCIRLGRIQKLSPNNFQDLVIKKFKLKGNGMHSSFKARANKLFIENMDYVFLLDSTKLKPQLNNLTNVYHGLKELKAKLRELFEIEVKSPYISDLQRIRGIGKSTFHIEFLYDDLLNYDDFRKLGLDDKWGPYQLLEKLKISVCPYCNREYTITVQKNRKKLTRPDLDHFLPKAKFKILQVSFYNLIPSCHVCNQGLKGSKRIYYSKHLNPYEDNPEHSLMRFTYRPTHMTGAQGISNSFEIEIHSNPKNPMSKKKVDGNKELFQLETIYNEHKDIVQDLIWKKDNWDNSHFEIIKNSFSDFNVTKADAFRLLFGNYYDEKDFTRRPLAKMTKDIAVQLKLDELI